jgi:small GTP-binding protein
LKFNFFLKGIDFQIKKVRINDKVNALQLWDTAGQERYKSVTKQYFRKADGVICMYDVTSEDSFKNLRNWIELVKESILDDCVLVILGSKIDLIEKNNYVVKYEDGTRLAEVVLYSFLIFALAIFINKFTSYSPFTL